MTGFVLWLLLLVFCWPLALAALVLYPLVWLLLLPLRVIGITVEGVFSPRAPSGRAAAQPARGRAHRAARRPGATG